MKQWNLDLAMVFRRWWLLGCSVQGSSVFISLMYKFLLKPHSEHPNTFVLDAGPNPIVQVVHDVHKSEHPNRAQPHVKLASIQVQVLQAGG